MIQCVMIYRLLTSVDVGVLFHVRLLVESLATVLARIGTRVRVDQEVGGQRRTPLESLAALLAIESLFAVMNRPVVRITMLDERNLKGR